VVDQAAAWHCDQPVKPPKGVSMEPAADDAHIRESMKTWWLTKRAPDYWRGLAGQVDPEPGVPAVLSELGLKLIGVIPR